MSVRCSCGANHDHAAFLALPPIEILDEGALRTIVLRWPRGAVVDVRECGCGRPIARLRRPPEPAGVTST